MNTTNTTLEIDIRYIMKKHGIDYHKGFRVHRRDMPQDGKEFNSIPQFADWLEYLKIDPFEILDEYDIVSLHDYQTERDYIMALFAWCNVKKAT